MDRLQTGEGDSALENAATSARVQYVLRYLRQTAGGRGQEAGRNIGSVCRIGPIFFPVSCLPGAHLLREIYEQLKIINYAKRLRKSRLLAPVVNCCCQLLNMSELHWVRWAIWA